MPNFVRWSSKFEIRKGKWVYAPTREMIAKGREIKLAIESVWKRPSYFYHLRPGGHVRALKEHSSNSVFLRVDIQDFFGSINRSRITRTLKPYFGYSTARNFAIISTVKDPTGAPRYVLPFGFVQSQALASLCLHYSALGRTIQDLSCDKDLTVTVYVDDIIVSTRNQKKCSEAHSRIISSADRARFTLSSIKTEGPATSISAFNIALSHTQLAINKDRLDQFMIKLESESNKNKIDGILGYVSSVSPAQVEEIRKTLADNLAVSEFRRRPNRE